MDITSTKLLHVFLLQLLMVTISPKAGAQFSYKTVDVLYDSAKTFGNLQLVPVKFKDCECDRFYDRYMGLAEAMRDKKVQVDELPARKGSHKGAVTFRNRSGKHIVIYSGDLLAGGQQDRVMTQSIIIPPRRRKEVPAFCIERNRWDDKPKPFAFAGASDWPIRKLMDTRKSQRSIWNEISTRQKAVGSKNINGSMLTVGRPDSLRMRSYVDFFEAQFEPQVNEYAGFMFITGDTILSVELFAKAEYTAAVFESMVSTYAQAVAQHPEPPVVSDQRKKDFMDKVLTQGTAQAQLVRRQGIAHYDNGVLLHIVVYGHGF